ncbi:MAG: cytidine deaminase [Clostridia bacterium]|nr:cytidine deaminase [Clostridia bacterium]
MTDQELLLLAEQARENAYAPYSRFLVGAALLAADGRVFLGANVENASFGATNCAERSAIFAAVSAGVRDFVAIAICGAKQGGRGTICTPCGICRQVLSEFCNSKLRVLLGNSEEYREYTLAELLPHSFGDEVKA